MIRYKFIEYSSRGTYMSKYFFKRDIDNNLIQRYLAPCASMIFSARCSKKTKNKKRKRKQYFNGVKGKDTADTE